MLSLFGICSVLFVIINIANGQSPCKTPDNYDGACIALQQCRSLYKLVRRNLPAEQRNFLRNSQCGHDGTSPLVCCPTTFTIDDLPSGKQCGPLVADRIIGGDRAGLTDFPWLTLLHYTKPAYNARGRSGYFCGGSLIHENYVLTAAHCVRGALTLQKNYVLDSVRLGENDLRGDPDCIQEEGKLVCANSVDDVPVAEIIAHEDYDPWSRSQANDIALIRLQRPATITNYTRPVCLPIGDLQNKNYAGLPLSVAGFGKTENATRSEFKMKVDLYGVNSEECSNAYQRFSMNIADNVLCAGGVEGKDSCNGDSGGPLVADEMKNNDTYTYLVGVVSLGPSYCGTPGIPGVYTRVDKYFDWILDHMKK